jgi:hypothetical protein
VIAIGKHLLVGVDDGASKFTVMHDLGPVERFVPTLHPRVLLDRDEAEQLRAAIDEWLGDDGA